MLLPVAYVFIGMIATVAGASLAKDLFPVLGGLGAAAVRILLSAILLAAAFRPWNAKIDRHNIRAVCIYGALLAGMNITFYLAIARIPLGITIAIEFVGPLGLAILGSRRPADFLWVGLAIAGLLLLTPWVPGEHALDPLGLLFAALAGVCWGTYIVFGQRASHEHGTVASAIGMAVAALLTFPIVVLKADILVQHPMVLPLALAVALLSSAIPYALEMISLRHIPAATYGIMMSAQPAIAAMTGYLLLNEKLTVTQMGAILAITVASAGATLTAARTPKFQEPL
jgi:inner membrane transporter RhtA